MTKFNYHHNKARQMMMDYYDGAAAVGDEVAMENILHIIELYDAGYETLAEEQAQLANLQYRGAMFEGDSMGFPADEIEWGTFDD